MASRMYTIHTMYMNNQCNSLNSEIVNYQQAKHRI